MLADTGIELTALLKEYEFLCKSRPKHKDSMLWYVQCTFSWVRSAGARWALDGGLILIYCSFSLDLDRCSSASMRWGSKGESEARKAARRAWEEEKAMLQQMLDDGMRADPGGAAGAGAKQQAELKDERIAEGPNHSNPCTSEFGYNSVRF